MEFNRDIHKANLQALVLEYGGNKPLADAINKGLKADQRPVDPSQISQALNDHRAFGEKIHRKIEAALGLPPQWFEHAHTVKGEAGQKGRKTLSQEAMWLAHLFDRLPPSHQESLLKMVEPHAATWAPDLVATQPRKVSNNEKGNSDDKQAGPGARSGHRAARAISKSDT